MSPAASRLDYAAAVYARIYSRWTGSRSMETPENGYWTSSSKKAETPVCCVVTRRLSPGALSDVAPTRGGLFCFVGCFVSCRCSLKCEIPWQIAFDRASDGDEFVITRYRDTISNLRTQFLRIIDKAMVEPWPRLFQNLRASCETELT